MANIASISKRLEDLPETERLNRKDIELLFGVARSAASRLMEVVGPARPCDLDRGAVVTAEALRRYLESSPDAHAAMCEAQRREKLARALRAEDENLRLRRIILPVDPGDEWVTMAELPNVEISGGMLRVAYSSALELLGDLYRLAQAAGKDFEGFVRACEARRDVVQGGDHVRT